MTPPAATVAGRSAGKKRTSGSGAGAGSNRASGSGGHGPHPPPPRGHRRGLRQQAGPKAPRRVSGPVGGVVAVPPGEQPSARAPTPQPVRAPAPTPQPARAPTRTTQRPRPQQRPRRTSAARTRPARVRSARQRRAATPLGARVLYTLRTLPDHRLLDRLIRGRAWIPLLGVMLVGIVAMQVEVLKLGASIGRSIERTSTLQTRNDALRQEVASLDNDARIESLATKQEGMVMPAPGNVGFLSAGDAAAAVGRAVGNIHVPDAAGFLALASTNGTIATTSNSSTTGLAGLATMSSTLANTLAQSASQTSSGSSSVAQAPASQGATTPTTSTPSSTVTPTGATAPTGAQSQPASAQTQPASTTGTPSQSSSSAGTPVSTPTQSTSSGASGGSGGASLGG